MGADGVPLTLEEQDRGLWDRGAIDEGLSILESALRRRRPGSYQVQAAIAACQAEAATADETDWAQIVELYDQLRVIHPSPVIELSRAIAVAMLDGPEVGLALVSGLEPVLADYYLLAAARGDLLRRLGRADDAILCYRDAIALAPSEPERRFFARRIAELG